MGGRVGFGGRGRATRGFEMFISKGVSVFHGLRARDGRVRRLFRYLSIGFLLTDLNKPAAPPFNPSSQSNHQRSHVDHPSATKAIRLPSLRPLHHFLFPPSNPRRPHPHHSTPTLFSILRSHVCCCSTHTLLSSPFLSFPFLLASPSY